MDFLKHYLKEEDVDDEFIQEEPEDAIQEPEEDYGLDFVDDEEFNAPQLNVQQTPDNSDPILNADEFMYSNSEPQSYYAKGSGFDLADNQDLYEVIKSVKDLTDRHLYVRDMTWKVNVAHRKAVFSFKLGENEDENEAGNDFFFEGIQQHLMTQLFNKFGPLYKIETEKSKDNDGQFIMKMTVEKDDKEERRELKQVPFKTSELSTQSSVSKI